MPRYLILPAVLAALIAPVLCKASPTTAAEHIPTKPALVWTIEERLAERFDPAKAAARKQQYDRARGEANKGHRVEPGAGLIAVTVDGAYHPELLLPHELFEDLMTGLVPDEEQRHRQREAFSRGIRSLGFDEEEFWNALEIVGDEYAQSLFPAEEGVRQDPEIACQSAYRALSQARSVFGSGLFDRLLYEVVAPLTVVAVSTNKNDPAEVLRRQAEGCAQ